MPAPSEGNGGDADRERSIVVHAFRRALDWLRDLHRGYAYTGHLPRRRK